ncbi:hypothetical protein RJT34_09013 [Clitoria ternatea]|uniref:Uncharacterized protein n=1 Tax=Clitoria ternatea TaxID=43366 RepID=A0AAN9PUE8_CLITE
MHRFIACNKPFSVRESVSIYNKSLSFSQSLSFNFSSSSFSPLFFFRPILGFRHFSNLQSLFSSISFSCLIPLNNHTSSSSSFSSSLSFFALFLRVLS